MSCIKCPINMKILRHSGREGEGDGIEKGKLGKEGRGREGMGLEGMS